MKDALRRIRMKLDLKRKRGERHIGVVPLEVLCSYALAEGHNVLARHYSFISIGNLVGSQTRIEATHTCMYA